MCYRVCRDVSHFVNRSNCRILFVKTFLLLKNKCLSRISAFSMYFAGEQCFLRNLIGSSIPEYPAPFTSEQNKMASSFVYVTEELYPNKRSRRAIQYQ